MSAVQHPEETTLQPDPGSHSFRNAGPIEGCMREIVWVLIAVAFCVVEAVVFVTDLPVAKFFQRRARK